jgi:uncharacterized protein YggE
MRQVLAAVKAAGVDPKDVQTARYDVQVERPWKDGQPGPITGYHVSNLARVKVRDLAKLGDVLDRVGAAGSNAIQGLTFEKEDSAREKARALADAVNEARVKAEALAKAAGVASDPVDHGKRTGPAAAPDANGADGPARGGAPVEPGGSRCRRWSSWCSR